MRHTLLRSFLLFIAIAAIAARPNPASVIATQTPDRMNAPTADGSPTLQVTSDWLNTTLQAYGGYPWNDTQGDDTILSASIDNNCIFSWTDRYTYKTDIKAKVTASQYNMSVPLGAITSIVPATGNSASDLVAVAIMTGNLDVIQPSGVNFARPSTTEAMINVQRMPIATSGAEVPVPPVQMVPRIITALQHAVTLCQGTYAAPVQAPQPF